MFKKQFSILLFSAVLQLHVSIPCRGDTTNDVLHEVSAAAPLILAELERYKCRNVGVLKFVVRDEHRRIRNDAQLSLLSAQWLETALRRERNSQDSCEVKFVTKTNAVAAKTGGANHLTKPGQKRLFAARYPLDGQGVKVDTLITGRIQLRADLKSAKLVISAIQPDERHFLLHNADVSTRDSLSCMSHSYHRREGADPEEDYKLARQVMEDAERFHPQNGNPLICFQVLYDGKLVDHEVVNGIARIPEPDQGQQVTLRLERLDRSNRLLAAVVRVNGENVLGRQRVADVVAHKYVMEKGAPAIEIKAFQQDEAGGGAFTIAPREQGTELEMYYGPDVGTISVTLFKEGTALDADSQGIALGKDAASDRVEPEQYRVRGIIHEGKRIAQPIRLVEKRDWDPIPMLSSVIHYYRPVAR